jgi:putative hydrolase of the HAD superfamily
MIKTPHFHFLALIFTIQTGKEAFGFLLSYPTTSRSSSRNSQQSNTQREKDAVALNANLITFDLDDTIFPVAPVVADANKALFKHLKSLGCETTQDEYVKTTKEIRVELAKDDKVITYTELRKRAIRAELERHLPGEDISDSIVSRSYGIWEEYRHTAAETYLYPGTISMLKELKTNHPHAVIAAITNGKGNPLKMDSIREFFDFCVSGEDEDVFPLRKPNDGIYKVALERFRALSETRKGGAPPIDIETKEGGGEEEEPWCWIHVGDDLANDVGASAKCGAKAIWVDLGDEYNQTALKRDPSQPQPAWSTATKEELETRKLLDEQAQKYVSKRVTTLEMLPLEIENITQSVVQAALRR